ncbi:MAG: hypothetical protein AB3N16_07530 [Flavobacteriaceae bacterium]
MVEDIRVANKYLSDYSRLIPELEGYVFESENGDYILLPLTSGFLLYEVREKTYVELPVNGLTPNNDFKNNLFVGDKLVMVYSREVMIFDLETHHSVSTSFPFGIYQLKSATLKNGKLEITYKSLKDYQTYTREYCFEKMDFMN